MTARKSETSRPARRILVVDDDEFFRDLLEQLLQGTGYQVTSVAGGQQAQQILGMQAFDAIISDLNMPGVNGMQLLNWTKKNRPVPVILITSFADLAETLDAHTSGAAGFLVKPFKREELLEKLSTCLPSAPVDEPAQVADLDEEFYKLSLGDFVSGSDIKHDIYIRLSASKYVKIAHSGQDISVERIKEYKGKGVHFLYMTKEDFRNYVKFNVGLARAVAGSEGISREKKLNFLKHTSELIASSVFSDHLDADCVADARSVVETSVQLLSGYDDAVMVLNLLSEHADFVYAHSVAVSFYSVLLARKLKWTSSATFFKLSVGALFHDIGMKEIPREILTKARKNLSADETTFMESHASRGAVILGELPNLPSDATQIALEHHENCVGFGFPRRLRKDKIHPLARVVAVADEFCELAMKTPNSEALSPHNAVKRMITFNAEYYDPDTSIALMDLLKYPVPGHFVEDMKKRQRAT